MARSSILTWLIGSTLAAAVAAPALAGPPPAPIEIKNPFSALHESADVAALPEPVLKDPFGTSARTELDALPEPVLKDPFGTSARTELDALPEPVLKNPFR